MDTADVNTAITDSSEIWMSFIISCFNNENNLNFFITEFEFMKKWFCGKISYVVKFEKFLVLQNDQSKIEEYL